MSRSKTFIFDMDGTLIDSMPEFHIRAADLIHSYLPHISHEEARNIYASSIGLPFSQQLANHGINHPKLVSEWEKINQEVSLKAKVFPGVLDFLDKNSEVGYLALVSSNETEVVRLVLLKHFPWIFDWHSGKEHGTKIQQIEQFIAFYEIQDTELHYYGDTSHDEEVAEHVGAEFHMITGADSWKALIGNPS